MPLVETKRDKENIPPVLPPTSPSKRRSKHSHYDQPSSPTKKRDLSDHATHGPVETQRTDSIDDPFLVEEGSPSEKLPASGLDWMQRSPIAESASEAIAQIVVSL